MPVVARVVHHLFIFRLHVCPGAQCSRSRGRGRERAPAVFFPRRSHLSLLSADSVESVPELSSVLALPPISWHQSVPALLISLYGDEGPSRSLGTLGSSSSCCDNNAALRKATLWSPLHTRCPWPTPPPPPRTTSTHVHCVLPVPMENRNSGRSSSRSCIQVRVELTQLKGSPGLLAKVAIEVH
jgi:hypothetical protein